MQLQRSPWEPLQTVLGTGGDRKWTKNRPICVWASLGQHTVIDNTDYSHKMIGEYCYFLIITKNVIA